MAKKMSREEYDRGIEQIVRAFMDELRPAIPADLERDAIAWHERTPDDAMNLERDKRMAQVDAFIRRLPAHEFREDAEAFALAQPIEVIALSIERLAMMPGLMKSMPPVPCPETAGAFLEAWAIDAWKIWWNLRRPKSPGDPDGPSAA